MAITAKNRKKVEAKIIAFMKKMDPSGMNADKYKKIFTSMTDKDFVDFFKKMKSSDDFQFYVEFDLYGKNKVTLETIKEAADFLKVPLEEYVFMRHKTEDGSVIRTRYKVPVLYIHMKRMQQLLSKKTKTSTDITSGNTRSRITGSLNNDHKSGRFTDADTNALVSITDGSGFYDPVTGMDESPIIREVLGARGDNMKSKSKMLQSISLYGDTTLADDDTASVGQAVKTLDVFMLGAGLKTNLINKSYVSRQGIKDKS